MRKKLPTILLIVAFLAGLSLLLYPTVSDYWNSFHASQAIATYTEEVEDMSREQYDKIWSDAVAYNRSISARGNSHYLSDEQEEQYQNLLNVGGAGIMGYIEIPTIDVSLPICHGTDDSDLQVAVGHLEWSSLPVGGSSSHCVLSGHRGLPSARLFTNLDQLVEGDTFELHVLDEVLTYEVDQILVVEPSDTDALHIEEGKDLCTLVTCTPYGVNSHRLLVRGHRIENQPDAVRLTSDAVQIEPLIVAPLVALPILLVLLIILLASHPKKKSTGGKENAKSD